MAYFPPLFLLVIYLTFHFYPATFHKKRSLGPTRSKVSKIAHRGSRLEGITENTKAAFKDAIDAGADVIELDVWLSADKKVVVFHDETFKRMTKNKRSERVIDLKYENYPSLVPPEPEQSTCNELFARKDWSKIPLLEEVLSITPSHVCMIIEFKQDSDELISEVQRLLSEQGRIENTFWFSLTESINKKLRAADKRIPTICSVIGMLKTLFLYYTALLPFFPLEDAVFGITVEEITLEQVREEKAVKDLPDFIKVFLSYLLAGRPPSIMVNPGLFRHLRNRGVPVWFLGVNSIEDLQLAATTGATGVLTDRPKWLEKSIISNNIKFERISE